MYKWENFQMLVQKVSVVVAVLLNSLFFFLVIRHSPKSLGTYKYLMISICIFEFWYAIIDVTLLPIIHSFGSTFVIIFQFKTLIHDKMALELCACLYCAFFGSSLAIFSIHFVYRFWAISGSRKLRSFNGWRVCLWLLIPVANGLNWAFFAWFACRPRTSTDDYLRNSILETYDLPLEHITYLAPYFYEKTNNGVTQIYYPSFVGIIVDSFTIITSVLTATLYAFKCYQTLQKLLESRTKSEKVKRIQSQLFYSLVTQTLIPAILMHIPVGMMFISAFTGQDVGSLCGIVSITVALYPALDPIPTILIVKDYRKALFNYICVNFLRLVRKPAKSTSSTTSTRI